MIFQAQNTVKTYSVLFSAVILAHVFEKKCLKHPLFPFII